MGQGNDTYLLQLLLAYPALPRRIDNSHEFKIVSQSWLEPLERVHLHARVSLLWTTLEVYMGRIRRHPAVASRGVRPHGGETVQRGEATVCHLSHVIVVRRVEKHTRTQPSP